MNWIGCLPDGKRLSPDMVSRMLRRQSGDGLDAGEGHYGCGVRFLSEYHPGKKLITALVSNYGDNAWEEMRRIRTFFEISCCVSMVFRINCF